MDKLKAKNSSSNLRYYWYFFIPLTVILSLMIFFPLRIGPGELMLDLIFYGTITLACIMSTIYVFRRFRKRGQRLIAVILLCTLLSGWQVFDLAILRTPGWGSWMDKMHYSPRFEDNTIICHTVSEKFIGNHLIRIVYEINRQDSWPVCGG